MKRFLLFCIICVTLFSKEIEVYDFKTLLSATQKSIQENRNDVWIFRRNGVVLDIKNPLLQKELLKFYNYMKEQKTPIDFYKISSIDMCKTIIKGQNILVIQDSNYIPKRNDIIMFNFYSKISPYSQPTIKNGKLEYIKHTAETRVSNFIKRCVAVGGDEIFMKDKHLFLHPYEGSKYIKKNFNKNKIVKINQKLFVRDPYMIADNYIFHDKNITKNKSTVKLKLIDFNLTKIPKNCFFVMGDNREYSKDSRHYGCIRKKDISGKVVLLKFKQKSKIVFGSKSIKDSVCRPIIYNTENYKFITP